MWQARPHVCSDQIGVGRGRGQLRGGHRGLGRGGLARALLALDDQALLAACERVHQVKRHGNELEDNQRDRQAAEQHRASADPAHRTRLSDEREQVRVVQLRVGRQHY